MMTASRFAFDFYGWSRLLFSLSGHGPAASYVEVLEDKIRVRSGWLFQVEVPRSAIVRVYRRSNPWWNIGAAQTSFTGSWAVGGAYRNIVALDLHPSVRGRYMSVFPVSMRRLFLSLQEPDRFIAALT